MLSVEMFDHEGMVVGVGICKRLTYAGNKLSFVSFDMATETGA